MLSDCYFPMRCASNIEKKTTKNRRNERLVEWLQNGHEDALFAVQAALESTGQEHVATLLDQQGSAQFGV